MRIDQAPRLSRYLSEAAASNKPIDPAAVAYLAILDHVGKSAPEVVAAASKHAGRPLATPVEVFTAVREWKNGFR